VSTCATPESPPHRTAIPVSTAPAASSADLERSRRLIYALAAADLTLDALAPALKRALSHERRPLNRDPPTVRRELELACRLSQDLTDRLGRARANLPPPDARPGTPVR
jgi:hypothetical protein